MLRPTLIRAYLAAAAVSAGIALLAPASATAQTSTRSQNWSGYAVHGPQFRSISARWRQPQAACGSTRSYSAMWVGLGGYKLTSPAVEQVGTELDCIGGRPTSSAWYELTPSPSHRVRIGVHPGDLIAASVTAAGGRITVAISDLSRRRLFQKTISPANAIDLSSAEWILEAPSECIFGTSVCQTLPLANFGRAQFTLARAQTTGGGLGTISTAGGQDTKIILGPRAPLFVTVHPGQVPVGTANPSALLNGGSSFTITYQRRYVAGGLLLGSRTRARTYFRH
jgi:hypothetical protein